MNQPDFACSIEDNRGILVVIHQLGPSLPPEQWKTILDAVTKYRQLCFENTPREINFRYQLRQSCRKTDRHEFQIHRRVFGLICLATSEFTGDVDEQKRETLKLYNGYLAHYGDNVLESRCFVFRSHANINQTKRDNLSPPEATSSSFRRGLSPEGNGIPNGFNSDILRPVHKSYSETNLTQPQGSTTVLPTTNGLKTSKSYIEIQLNDAVSAVLHELMEDYLLSLFSSLEAKRPTSVPDKVDKNWKGSNPSLDKPETVKKDVFSFDLGNARKKRQLGSMRRSFAEWLLLTGLPYPAAQNFSQAAEMLQSAKEHVQNGAALEGWAAASWYVLPAADPQLALKLAAADRPDQRIILTRTKAASANGYLVNAFNLNVSDHGKDRKHCLTSDLIYEKLRLAALSYSLGETGISELEASLKLARLFIFLGDKIMAHNGLRQATFAKIDTGAHEAHERIDRFLTIAELYESIGFVRQAALFRLLAADRYIAPHNPVSSFVEAFRLTAKSLPVYSLSLSTKPLSHNGWPELQAQVLMKLGATCRPHPGVHQRVLLMALENFSDVLSVDEKELILRTLTELIHHHGSPHGEILTEAGFRLGVVTLTKIPFVHDFAIVPLPHHLQPLQRPKLKRGLSTPFIYAPWTSDKKISLRALHEADFTWVAEEPCFVQLQISNKLPKELRVDNLTVISDTVPFDATEASLILPPMAGPLCRIMITGTPSAPGLLSMLGYSFSVFGIKSSCYIAELSQFAKNPPPKFIRIAPSLPQLKVEISLPPCDVFVDVGEPVVATASLQLYKGQRSTQQVKLTNVGKELVETLSVTITAPDNVTAERCVSFRGSTLADCLPIRPGTTATIEMDIWAALSFIEPQGSLLPGSISQPPEDKPETFQFFLRIEYSGGGGLLEDYYRILTVVVFVDVLPSVSVTDWSILSAEKSDEFYLVVDFQNQSDEEIEVSYPPDKKMLIFGRDHARIPALSKKVPLCDASHATAQDLCRRHLANSMNLQWKFMEKNVMGHCWIGDFVWDTDRIQSVMLPPVSVEFYKDGTEISLSKTTGCSVGVGVAFTVDVTLTNQFDSKIVMFKSGIEIREERDAVNCDIAVSSIALLGGSTELTVDFEAHVSHTLTCQAVMLIPGVFHLDVFFECGGRRWTAADSCPIIVSSTIEV